MNSFYILAAFAGFIVLGYATVVRLLHKYQFSDTNDQVKPALKDILFHTGNGALFVALSTLGILLFWGWGPALLWLVAAHLLIETPANLITVQIVQEVDLADHFADSSSLKPAIRTFMLQAILCIVTAFVLSLLARLLDQQSGLVFSIAGIMIGLSVLRANMSRQKMVLLTFSVTALLLVCLALARSMGISFFGNFTPFSEPYDWLRFDNLTLICLGLLIFCIWLCRSAPLRRKTTSLSGLFILTFAVIVCATLIWQQPLLDAPTLSSEQRNDSLPNLTITFFFVTALFLSILIRLTNPSTTSKSVPQTRSLWLSIQSASLLSVIVCLASLLWLATANGLGAWNTHFIDWPINAALDTQFTLLLRSIEALGEQFGLEAGITRILWQTAFCVVALSMICNLLLTLLTLSMRAQEQLSVDKSVIGMISANLWLKYGAILFVALWMLDHSIGVYKWIWLGSLCWVLVSDVLLEYASELEESSLAEQIIRAFAVALFGFGVVQLLILGLQSILNSHTLYAVSLFCSLGLGLLFAGKSCLMCIQGLKRREQTPLF